MTTAPTPWGLAITIALCLLAGQTGTAVSSDLVAADTPPEAGHGASAEAPGGWEPDTDEWQEEWQDEDTVQGLADPLEGLNRAVFAFNDRFYFWALKPVAQGYKAVLPEAVRVRVKNFFYNVLFPVRFTNNVLQARIEEAGYELFRFLLNSSVGVLGFFNPAQHHPELTPAPQDTGLTLGVWGSGNGPYIVWPLLGPSTLRDTGGMAFDFVLDPVTYVNPLGLSLAARGVDTVNRTSLVIGDYEALKEASFDPYTAVKDAYLQHRQKALEK